MTAMATREDGKIQTIKGLFDAAKSKIAEVAPKHLSPDRLMRVALLTISRTPKLASCTPHSLLNSMMDSSRSGLEIGDGPLAEAYLVPYGNEAKFMPSYRGLIKLARQNGDVRKIEAKVVREGDVFSYEYGSSEHLRHKPLGNADDKITHAWAMATLPNGDVQFDVMRLDEVESIRQRSRAKNDGPWKTDYAEMAKKTVVRRLCKYLSMSPQLKEVIEAGDRAEFGDTFDGEVAERSTLKDRIRARAALPDTQLPEDEAAERAAKVIAEQAADDQPSPEPDIPHTEPAAPEAEPQTEDPALTALLAGPWKDFEKACIDKMRDHGWARKDAEGALFKWAQKNPNAGEDQRRDLWRAVCGNLLLADGTYKV